MYNVGNFVKYSNDEELTADQVQTLMVIAWSMLIIKSAPSSLFTFAFIVFTSASVFYAMVVGIGLLSSSS